jgi:hypothetical protein
MAKVTRHLVPLLLTLIAVLWWRVAPWGSRGPMVGRPAGQRGERGGRREYVARLDLLP